MRNSAQKVLMFLENSRKCNIRKTKEKLERFRFVGE